MVILTSRFPYPLEKGDKLRLFHQLKDLSANFEIYLISITDYGVDKHHLEKIRPYVTELHCFRFDGFLRYLSILKYLFTKIPLQVRFFYNKSIARNINELIDRIKPNHIYCQLARMAEYTKQLPYDKTIDYMDAFGVGMERRAMVATYFTRYVYQYEAALMKSYEQNIFFNFNHHLIISNQDKLQFHFNGTEKLLVVPNGIDNSFFEYEEKEKKYELVFVGNMGYLPNVEAAEFLAKEIMPKLSKEIKLIIAGARPDHRVKILANDRIVVTGWMEDIREAYATSKIFIAPIWSGTGQQNKILEAMAMGLPCITTGVVNNAILAKSDQEILIAETANDFVHQINVLLANPDKIKNIGRNASIFVKQNYAWSHNNQVLNRIFASQI